MARVFHHNADDITSTARLLALVARFYAAPDTHGMGDPGDWVGHSWIDDAFPIVPMPGLLSVVVPDHAVDADPAAFGIYCLEVNGSWVDAAGAISW